MRSWKLLVLGVVALVLAGGAYFTLGGTSKASAIQLPPGVTASCSLADPDTDGNGPDTGIVQCEVSVRGTPYGLLTIVFNDRNGNGRPDFRDQLISLNFTTY